jgi:hypothetical protein
MEILVTMVVIFMILIMRHRKMNYEILLPYFLFFIGIPIYHILYVLCFYDTELEILSS